jgi:hypothetical protein
MSNPNNSVPVGQSLPCGCPFKYHAVFDEADYTYHCEPCYCQYEYEYNIASIYVEDYSPTTCCICSSQYVTYPDTNTTNSTCNACATDFYFFDYGNDMNEACIACPSGIDYFNNSYYFFEYEYIDIYYNTTNPLGSYAPSCQCPYNYAQIGTGSTLQCALCEYGSYINQTYFDDYNYEPYNCTCQVGYVGIACQLCDAGYYMTYGYNNNNGGGGINKPQWGCFACTDPNSYTTYGNIDTTCYCNTNYTDFTGEKQVTCVACSQFGYTTTNLDEGCTCVSAAYTGLQCDMCSNGYIGNPSNGEPCVACPLYSNSNSNSLDDINQNCTCDANYVQITDPYTDSAVACEPCLNGGYTNTTGATECICPTNSHGYQVYDESTNCEDCLPDHYWSQTEIHGVFCIHCPMAPVPTIPNTRVPTHNNRVGQDLSCSCPDNYTRPALGVHITCVPCLNGGYIFSDIDPDGDKTQCQGCDIGTTGSNCQFCANGYFNSSTTGLCTACPINNYVASDLSGCLPCSIGSYSNGGDSTSCYTGCLNGGQHIVVNGVNTCNCTSEYTGPLCQQCSADYYMPSGNAPCVSCPGVSTTLTGNYQATSCTCPDDYAQQSSGSTIICTACGDNSTSLSGATFCSNCEVGYTGIECDVCKANYYMDLENPEFSGLCSPCPANSTTSAGNSDTTCLCVVGFLQVGYGSNVTCQACQNGGTTLNGLGQQSQCNCTNGYTSALCNHCSEDYYMDNNNNVCTSCPLNSHSNGGLVDTCICNTNFTQSGSGSSLSCSPCQHGSNTEPITTSGASTCSNCLASNGFTGEDCSVCPSPQFYIPIDSPQECIPCPANSISIGNNSNSCICDDNYIYNEQGTECVSCNHGSVTYSSSSNECICYSNSGYTGTYCNLCAAGYYYSPIDNTCNTCPHNSNSPNGNLNTTCTCQDNFAQSGTGSQLTCIACQNGGTSVITDSTPTNCSCPIYGYTGDTCNECRENFYFDNILFECIACPSLSQSPGGLNIYSCTCPANYIQSGSGPNAECTPCGNSEHSSPGATSCSNCVQNYTGNACTSCNTNYYYDSTYNACLACPEYSSSTGVDANDVNVQTCECITNYASLGGDGGSLMCQPCLYGSTRYYGSSNPNCTCITNAYTGATCNVCSQDYYWNSGVCDPCPFNTTTPNGNSVSTCTCPENYSQTGFGASVNCEACEHDGTDVAGAMTCTQCDLGYTGMTCDVCDVNYYLNSATQLCTPCPGNSTTLSTTGTNTCTCNAGFANIGSGSNLVCSPCMNGGTSQAGDITCTCVVPTNGYTGVTCTTCNVGYYTNNHKCILCPAGQSSSGGTSSCVCPANYVQSGSTCTACANGGVSQQGATSCSDCNPGSFGTTCQHCLTGYYNNSNTCITCPTGLTNYKNDSTTCTCPTNYAQILGNTGTIYACDKCENGGNATAGASACTCPSGYTGVACDNSSYNYHPTYCNEITNQDSCNNSTIDCEWIYGNTCTPAVTVIYCPSHISKSYCQNQPQCEWILSGRCTYESLVFNCYEHTTETMCLNNNGDNVCKWGQLVSEDPSTAPTCRYNTDTVFCGFHITQTTCENDTNVFGTCQWNTATNTCEQQASCKSEHSMSTCLNA